jgi:hypothetical protein
MAILEGITQLMPAVGFAAGGAIAALSSPRAAFAVSAGGVALVALGLAIRPIDRVTLRVTPETEATGDPFPKATDMQENEASARTRQLRSLTLG